MVPDRSQPGHLAGATQAPSGRRLEPRRPPDRAHRRDAAMASTRIVENECGTYRGGPTRRHNGYWAGDFSKRAAATAGPTPCISFARSPERSTNPASSPEITVTVRSTTKGHL